MANQNSALVSVIIPSYNGSLFLVESIESVLAQTYSHFEIIVVDDGSTDNTREIAMRYGKAQYFYQENQGVCIARNHGYQESRGDFLVFLDQDDRLFPNALQVGIDAFRRHPESGCVVGRFRAINEFGYQLDSNLSDSSENFRLPEICTYQTLLSGYTFGPPAGVMIRRNIFEEAGRFNPSSLHAVEDLDLYLRMARKSSAYYHGQAIFDYRRHGKNSSNNPLFLLENCLKTLDRQRSYIEGNYTYELAYKSGKKLWKQFFYQTLPYCVVASLKEKEFGEAWNFLLVGLRHAPLSFVKYIIQYPLRKAGSRKQLQPVSSNKADLLAVKR